MGFRPPWSYCGGPYLTNHALRSNVGLKKVRFPFCSPLDLLGRLGRSKGLQPDNFRLSAVTAFLPLGVPPEAEGGQLLRAVP